MTLLDAVPTAPAAPAAPAVSARPRTGRPGLRDVPRVRLALAQVATIAPLTVAHAAHVSVPLGLTTAAVTVAVTALVLPVRYALATAVVAWAWLTAFVVHTGAQDGRLSFADADLTRLGVLAAVAVVAAVIARLVDRRRAWPVRAARRRRIGGCIETSGIR